MTKKESGNSIMKIYAKTVWLKTIKAIAILFSFVIPVYVTGLLLVGSDEFRLTGWSKFNTIGDYTSKLLFLAPMLLAIIYFIKNRWSGKVITKIGFLSISFFTILQFIIFIVFGHKLNLKTANATRLSAFYDTANVAYIIEIAGLVVAFGFILWYLLFKAKLNQKSQTLLGAGLGITALLTVWHIWNLRTKFLNPITSGMSPKLILQYLQVYTPNSDLRYTTNIYTINMSYMWVITALLLGYIVSSYVWSKFTKHELKKKGEHTECLENQKTLTPSLKSVSQHQSSKSSQRTKRQLKRLKNKS